MIFGAIISKKLATLKDIQTFYTYEDCLDLLDIVLVDVHNENIMLEDIENGK
jgi:hypothetical protein